MAVSELVCYSSDQIPHIWEDVKGHIQTALDRGSIYSLQDIRMGLCTQQMQLWVWRDDEVHAALVTAIQEKRGVKFCLYLCLAGSKMDEWGDLMHLVEDWAKEKGCTEMRIYGRAGWAKAFGFEIDYTKMTRAI